MPATIFYPLAGLLLLLVAVALWLLRVRGLRKLPTQLRRGRPLPEFRAQDENGAPVSSSSLHGAPAVLLFVRGGWCPFCSSQVERLTRHYKDIVDLGGRLILVTPKPAETTRRVADFFDVEFEFWLDDSLAAASKLGLLMPSGVPKSHRREYGDDTVWPTAIVVDSAGIIRYVSLSRHLSDRPEPKALVDALRDAAG